jgi:hypothetical protein
MVRSNVLAALAVLATCLACAAPGKAERIGTRADGGSIMISANNDKAWESAKELMSSHCDGSYRVITQMQETLPARGGGVPPATPSAMADPIGPAGAPYGIRIDYECTRGPAPMQMPPRPAAEPEGTPPPAPPKIPQTQTPAPG